ncbi:MAG: hypothetical protein J6Y68_01835, partial [Clostridia bacterium]|nr:hypothetical protein [Clostridia bacterium]
ENEDENVRRLMLYLATFCKNKTQLLRIFKTSGQFDNKRATDIYDRIAEEQIRYTINKSCENKTKQDVTANTLQKSFDKSK